MKNKMIIPKHKKNEGVLILPNNRLYWLSYIGVKPSMLFLRLNDITNIRYWAKRK